MLYFWVVFLDTLGCRFFVQAMATQPGGMCKELWQSLHKFRVGAKSLSPFFIPTINLICSETDPGLPVMYCQRNESRVTRGPGVH